MAMARTLFNFRPYIIVAVLSLVALVSPEVVENHEYLKREHSLIKPYQGKHMYLS